MNKDIALGAWCILLFVIGTAIILKATYDYIQGEKNLRLLLRARGTTKTYMTLILFAKQRYGEKVAKEIAEFLYGSEESE